MTDVDVKALADWLLLKKQRHDEAAEKARLADLDYPEGTARLDDAAAVADAFIAQGRELDELRALHYGVNRTYRPCPACKMQRPVNERRECLMCASKT